MLRSLLEPFLALPGCLRGTGESQMTDQKRDPINNPLVFKESCATLIELLIDLHDDKLPRVSGLEKLDEKQRAFLMVTCSATIIGNMISLAAGYDRKTALEGFDTLREGIVAMIKDLCKEKSDLPWWRR